VSIKKHQSLIAALEVMASEQPIRTKLDSARSSSHLLDSTESGSGFLMSSQFEDDNRSSIISSVDRSKVCFLPKKNGTVRRLVWF
jgi:hypothetical protein